MLHVFCASFISQLIGILSLKLRTHCSSHRTLVSHASLSREIYGKKLEIFHLILIRFSFVSSTVIAARNINSYDVEYVYISFLPESRLTETDNKNRLPSSGQKWLSDDSNECGIKMFAIDTIAPVRIAGVPVIEKPSFDVDVWWVTEQENFLPSRGTSPLTFSSRGR